MNKRIVLIAVGILGLFFALPKIFSGQWILSQYFRLGPLTVHYYGITMTLAVLAGVWLAEKRRVRNFPDLKFQMDNFYIWLMVAGFAGARLYHVLSSLGFYVQHPLDIFKVWQGGLGVYGALLGGFVVLVFYSGKYKLSVLKLLDWLASSFLLGQIIGRFGNLFNYEAYGYPTSLPWKMFVPEQFRVAPYLSQPFYHPLFLYEALLNSASLVFLFYLARRNPHRGALFFFYLLLYNLARFLIEFLRVDSTFIGGLRLNSIVSAGLIAVSICGLLFIRRFHEKNP